MSTFVGGSLKLKGGKPLPVKGGVKKKKKKCKTGTELAVVEDGQEQQQEQQQGEPQLEEGEGKQQGKVVKVTPDGVVLDSSAVADRRTKAEKKFEAHMLKYEEERAKKTAAKSHRERIKEFNEKLANLTEHHDLFRVSYTA